MSMTFQPTTASAAVEGLPQVFDQFGAALVAVQALIQPGLLGHARLFVKDRDHRQAVFFANLEVGEVMGGPWPYSGRDLRLDIATAMFVALSRRAADVVGLDVAAHGLAEPGERLRVGHGGGILRLAQAGDVRGVVGRRRDRALLERCQQLTGDARQGQLARAWQQRLARGLDVVDFRVSTPLGGALVCA